MKHLPVLGTEPGPADTKARSALCLQRTRGGVEWSYWWKRGRVRLWNTSRDPPEYYEYTGVQGARRFLDVLGEWPQPSLGPPLALGPPASP